MENALHIPLDDESLRRAYDALRQPHWPAWPSVMNDPVYGRLITGAARREAMGLSRPAITVQRPQVHRPDPAAHLTHQPDPHDRKRAAAGDRDD